MNTPLSKRENASFVKKVNTLLKNIGMSKAELATIGNTKPSTFRMWLLGKNRVTEEGKHNFESALEGRIMDLENELEALDSFLGPKVMLESE